MEDTTSPSQIQLEPVINDVLGSIEREREREIISRRFGLFDRRETLEQIGELLGITRERVRQLEKAAITRLKTTANDLPHIKEIEKTFIDHLKQVGKVARTSEITARVVNKPSDRDGRIDQARVAF